MDVVEAAIEQACQDAYSTQVGSVLPAFRVLPCALAGHDHRRRGVVALPCRCRQSDVTLVVSVSVSPLHWSRFEDFVRDVTKCALVIPGTAHHTPPRLSLSQLVTGVPAWARAAASSS